jgi:hypothetical protein
MIMSGLNKTWSSEKPGVANQSGAYIEYIYTILINFIHVFAQFITVHVWICLYNGVNLFRQAVPCALHPYKVVTPDVATWWCPARAGVEVSKSGHFP